MVILVMLLLGGCVPKLANTKTENKSVPASFNTSQDTTNTAKIKWREYFNDPALIAIIDTALKNNQELNITMQEIEIGKNEVRARKGEYLPFIGFKGGAGLEKEGRFTRHGAVDESIEIKPGTAFSEPLPDYVFGVYASWEMDAWKKLRMAKKAAVVRYLSSVEGKNFMVTNLIAEMANSYYELMALDNLLETVQRNIDVQRNALQIIKQEKEAAKVTQLAVNRFEAQLLNTQNLQYDIQQKKDRDRKQAEFLDGEISAGHSKEFFRF